METQQQQQIEIRNWNPQHRNTLRGFFTVILPSGLVIHNISLHEKGDTRWIQLPTREYTNSHGEKRHAPFIEFTHPAIAKRFNDRVLDAIDRHFAQVVNHERTQQEQRA